MKFLEEGASCASSNRKNTKGGQGCPTGYGSINKNFKRLRSSSKSGSGTRTPGSQAVRREEACADGFRGTKLREYLVWEELQYIRSRQTLQPKVCDDEKHQEAVWHAQLDECLRKLEDESADDQDDDWSDGTHEEGDELITEETGYIAAGATAKPSLTLAKHQWGPAAGAAASPQETANSVPIVSPTSEAGKEQRIKAAGATEDPWHPPESLNIPRAMAAGATASPGGGKNFYLPVVSPTSVMDEKEDEKEKRGNKRKRKRRRRRNTWNRK